MTDRNPVVLEVALNGATQPSQNATVPREPAEIAEQALQCIEAGASVIHTHTHDPVRAVEDTFFPHRKRSLARGIRRGSHGLRQATRLAYLAFLDLVAQDQLGST